MSDRQGRGGTAWRARAPAPARSKPGVCLSVCLWYVSLRLASTPATRVH